MFNWIQRNVLEQKAEGRYIHTNYKQTSIKLLVVSMLSWAMGVISLITYARMFEVTLQYITSTERTVYIPSPKKKCFFYIEIDYNQNNLKYIKSISYDQLKGKVTGLHLEDLGEYGTRFGKPIYPAGQLPDSYFQDIITFKNTTVETNNIVASSDLERIGITEYDDSMIELPWNWSANTNKNAVPLNFQKGTADLPILDQRFLNWIQPSLFYPTKKLWGIIEDPPEELNVNVVSTSRYDKKLIFTNGSWLGFKNYLVPTIFFTIGLFTGIIAYILFMFSQYN